MFSQSDMTSFPPHQPWSADCNADGSSTNPSMINSSISSEALLAPCSTARSGKHQDNDRLSDLTSLATRLHKKSVLLAQERNSLHELEEKLTETRALIDKAQQTNREVHRRELQQIIAQHQAELSLFEAQDELNRARSSIDEVEAGTQAIKEENESLHAQWSQELETVYAPHELLLQGFFQRLQEAQENSKKKQETIERIQSATRQLKDSRKAMIREHHVMIDEIARFKEEEGVGVSNMSNLATQVKQALAQRSELRRQVRDANQKQRQLERDLHSRELHGQSTQN